MKKCEILLILGLNHEEGQFAFEPNENFQFIFTQLLNFLSTSSGCLGRFHSNMF